MIRSVPGRFFVYLGYPKIDFACLLGAQPGAAFVKSDPKFAAPQRSSEGGQQYRLFFLDALGHFEKSHEFEAEDDEAAISISEAWREGRRMELWQRDRRVRQWKGASDSS